MISRVICISLFYQNSTCFFFSILFDTPPKFRINGDEWEQKYLGSRGIFLKEFPKEAFVEAYMGENGYRDQRQQCSNLIDGYKVPQIENLKVFCRENNIIFSNVFVDIDTWSLRREI